MILNRQHFNLAGKCVIEKLIIQTPFRFKAVFPEEACFLYFKSGQVILSSPTDIVDVTASESILLKCGSYFADLIQNSSPGTMEVFAVHLYPDLLKDLYKNDTPPAMTGKAKPLSAVIKNATIFTHFIDGLNFYLENPTWITPDLILLKIKELILLLLQTDKGSTIAALIAQLFTPRQVHIKDVVQTHLYSNLSVAELATLAGLSLSSFKREFHIVYKDTPARFFKVKRLEQAQKLLQHSDATISEICYQVGFKDVSHFAKAFMKHTNLSPLEFKKGTRNNIL